MGSAFSSGSALGVEFVPHLPLGGGGTETGSNVGSNPPMGSGGGWLRTY